MSITKKQVLHANKVQAEVIGELRARLAQYEQAGSGDDDVVEALAWAESLMGHEPPPNAAVLANALRATWKELDEVKRERDAAAGMAEAAKSESDDMMKECDELRAKLEKRS